MEPPLVDSSSASLPFLPFRRHHAFIVGIDAYSRPQPEFTISVHAGRPGRQDFSTLTILATPTTEQPLCSMIEPAQPGPMPATHA
jgi:hypothetical protein